MEILFSNTLFVDNLSKGGDLIPGIISNYPITAGALHLNSVGDCMLTIDSCQFSRNSAHGGTRYPNLKCESDAYGGAFYGVGEQLVILNSTFDSNFAGEFDILDTCLASSLG